MQQPILKLPNIPGPRKEKEKFRRSGIKEYQVLDQTSTSTRSEKRMLEHTQLLWKIESENRGRISESMLNILQGKINSL